MSQDHSAHGKRGVLRSGDAVVRNGKVGRPVQLQISRFEASDGKRVVVRVADGAERAEARERLERLANRYLHDVLNPAGQPDAVARDRARRALRSVAVPSTPRTLVPGASTSATVTYGLD